MLVSVTIMNEMSISKYRKVPELLLTKFNCIPMHLEVLSRSLVYFKDGFLYPYSGDNPDEKTAPILKERIYPVLDNRPGMVEGLYIFSILPVMHPTTGGAKYLLTELKESDKKNWYNDFYFHWNNSFIM